MKAIGYILIVALAVHSLCGMRCLGTDVVAASPSSESDCHHTPGNEHEDSPSPSPTPDHSNSACASTQAFDGRGDLYKLMACHQALANLAPIVMKQISRQPAMEVLPTFAESSTPPGMILALRI